MTRTATKRIADMVARVLAGNDTAADRGDVDPWVARGEGLHAYARCLVGAWVARAQKAEAAVESLRAAKIDEWAGTSDSHSAYLAGLRREVADATARLDAYAKLDVQHDSDCPADHRDDGVLRECTCAMRTADPGRAGRDRAQTEWIATQIAGAGRDCSRCGEKIERYGGCTKRDGDGFRCGRRACEERV